jgi:hypothetical protein
MNDYEDCARMNDTARALRMEAQLAAADVYADYQEWKAETDFAEGDEPSDWRDEAALDAWDASLETPW